MSEVTQPTARLRASLANVAFAVEDRVAIGGAEVARGALEGAKRAAEAVKWPFERLAWVVQEHLVWPLQDRADGWSQTARVASAAGVGAVALGACALGLVLATGGNEGSTAAPVVAPVTPPAAPVAAPVAKAPAAPVLHGVVPTFKAEGEAGTTTAAGKASTDSGASAQGAATSQPAASGAKTATVGPEAIKVAHRFANAFVLYEVGKGDAKATAAFKETAAPELARSLARRPPRLPANVKVPKARVLNVVAGPQHGETFTVSVSLLRVGVTSELRLDMQKKKSDWLVTDIRG